MELPAPARTFILRVMPAKGGEIAGTVERARTGEKHRFRGLTRLGALIAQMLEREPGGDSEAKRRE